MIKCGELIPRFASRPITISLLFVRCIVLCVMCIAVVVESDFFCFESLASPQNGGVREIGSHSVGMARRRARTRAPPCTPPACKMRGQYAWTEDRLK